MTALSLFRNFDRDFTNDLSPFWFKSLQDRQDSTQPAWSSQLKYNDEKKSWQLIAEVAGVTKSNLKVDAKDGFLSVTGEKTKGFDLGQFEKHFRIPEGIDLEKVEAVFEDGILTVDLPLQAQKTPKTILIK